MECSTRCYTLVVMDTPAKVCVERIMADTERRPQADSMDRDTHMADVPTSRLTVTMSADIGQFQAKIAEAMADLEALAELAGSLGIVVEVDDGDAVEQSERARLAEKLPNCGWFDDRAVAAVVDAHRRNPHLFR